MNERGYVIIAARQTRYLELAIDAALALRAYNPEPIALICDAAVNSALPGRGSPFDDVIALPDEFNARNIWTLALGRISPFERTIAVDADFLAIRGFREFWDRMEGSPFAIQGEVLGRDSWALHHGLPVGIRLRLYRRHRYVKCNGGVIYFHGDRGRRVFDAAFAIHQARPKALARFFRDKTGRLSDEVLLGLAASDERVDLITNPLTFPWYPNQWIEDRERFLGIHFLGELPAALWARFKHEIPARRRAAGLPEDASLPLWEEKARIGFW